jgi:hypothetical protein
MIDYLKEENRILRNKQGRSASTNSCRSRVAPSQGMTEFAEHSQSELNHKASGTGRSPHALYPETPANEDVPIQNAGDGDSVAI